MTSSNLLVMISYHGWARVVENIDDCALFHIVYQLVLVVCFLWDNCVSVTVPNTQHTELLKRITEWWLGNTLSIGECRTIIYYYLLLLYCKLYPSGSSKNNVTYIHYKHTTSYIELFQQVKR